MRALGNQDLRAIVTDPGELAKGARLLDDGALSNLARHGDRLYADAAGAMAAPYKVSVAITGDKIAARCTCMAARTRPYCKHAAALLIAWSNAPDGFAESDGPPPGAAIDRKKRSTKKGKADDAALMSDGVARVVTLVRELAATGVASVAEGRGAAMHGLGEALRAGKLRRLSGRVRRLAALVERVESGARMPAEDYAELLCDLLLTARKLDKHLAGEPLDPRHVEELIGKTWRKADRAAATGLELIEYLARAEVTADGFVIREARFVDAVTGVHYADKQILPAFMARRTPARPSRAGLVLRGAAGSVFPGYPPRRIDLEDPGDVRGLDDAALGRLIAVGLAGAGAALAAFQEHRRDVFAPDWLPVTVRVDALWAEHGRLRAVDDDGAALLLPDDALLDDQLAGALRGARLRALIGELGLDRAVPVLVPRALVVELAGETLALRTLTSSGDLAAAPSRRRKSLPGAPAPELADWAAQARAAGASSAAVSLAEVRGEIAELLAQGVGSFTARAVEPLAARLAELGLDKPGQILAGIPARPDGERLEDVVRVHQVLGVAVIRVVGATAVDRAALVAVPGHDSVLVRRPERWLSLDDAARARAAGELDRWTAAAHEAHAFADGPPAILADQVHPWWSNASLSPLVADAVARLPDAVNHARRVLSATNHSGRTARQTAIRVLVAADLDGAPRHVIEILGRDGDVALRSFALELIDAARERAGDREAIAHRRDRRGIVAGLVGTLLHAGAADERKRAAFMLGDSGHGSAAAPLRQVWLTDPSDDVREAAALALGRLCDPESIDGFVETLRRRDDDRAARAAALALGEAGDSRGFAVLVDALAAGFKPTTVLAAVRLAEYGITPALRAAAAADPALGKRKAVRELLIRETGRA